MPPLVAIALAVVNGGTAHAQARTAECLADTWQGTGPDGTES